MPRPKKPKLKQVNARFFEDDVKYAKEMAASEGLTEWQGKLRSLLHLGVEAAKRRKVIK